MKPFLVVALLFACCSAFGGGQIPFMFIPAASNTNQWTGATDTNWSTATNWSFGRIPTLSETAYFNGNCTNCDVHINTNGTVVGAVLMESTYTGTMTQDTSKSFLSYGEFTMNGGALVTSNAIFKINGIFTMNSGTVTAGSGALQLVGFKNMINAGTFNAGTSVLTSQALTVASGATFKASSTTSTFTNSFVLSSGSTFDPNGGQIIMSRTSAGTSYPNNASGTPFNDLKFTSSIDGGLFSIFTTPMVVNGTLTLDSTCTAGTCSMGGQTITAKGPVNVSNGGIAGTGTAQIILLNAAGTTITVSGTGEADMPSLELGNSGATVTVTGGTPMIYNDLSCATTGSTVLNGSLNVNRNISAQCTLSGNAAITLTGTSSSSLAVGGGSFPSGHLKVNRSGATITLSSANTNLNGASQAMTIQAGTVNMNAKNLTVAGALTISSGAVLTKGGGTLTYGSLSNSGTLNP